MTIEIKESHGKQYKVSPEGTFFHIDTPDAVITALETVREVGERVRIFIGYTAPYVARTAQEDRLARIGEAWPEENDVSGYIGRTTGPVKSPILIHNRRSTGGGIISTDCILAIRQAAGGYVPPGAWLYRDAAFSTGKWELGEYRNMVIHHQAVLHNGQEHARFDTVTKAKRYIDFMQGNRGSK